MGKRKYQRVALLLGLLFLVFIIEGLLFYHAKIAVYQEEQERLGQLILKYPQFEQDLIKIYRGENNRDAMYRNAGARLEKKYGYAINDAPGIRSMQIYGSSMAIVLIVGIIGILYLWRRQRRAEELLLIEMERMAESKYELEQFFQQTKSKLVKEEQDTKALITDIAHQLKTPVAALKMGCEILVSTELSKTETEELQLQKYEEVQRLEVLLQSLMNVSKLEANLINIKQVNTSIKETLISATNNVYMKMSEKRIDIIMEKFEDIEIPHDSKWTAEAISNILENAIKYSESYKKIQVRVSQMISNILIEIEDEGIGIDSNEINQIFKRFYRGNHKIIQTCEGSGVGLYLARKIMEEQGGTICVKSVKHKGSIFKITLPKERF